MLAALIGGTVPISVAKSQTGSVLASGPPGTIEIVVAPIRTHSATTMVRFAAETVGGAIAIAAAVGPDRGTTAGGKQTKQKCG